MNETGLLSIFMRPATPLYMGVLLLAVYIVNRWPALMAERTKWWQTRSDAKAVERDKDWSRLREEISRLEERCARIEAREEECRQNLKEVRDELADERAERKKLQAIIDGWGEVRQAAANAAAEVRADEAEKAKKR
jgi:septal ring factor EnvC (AmiA/AmiB activator)